MQDCKAYCLVDMELSDASECVVRAVTTQGPNTNGFTQVGDKPATPPPGNEAETESVDSKGNESSSAASVCTKWEKSINTKAAMGVLTWLFTR